MDLNLSLSLDEEASTVQQRRRLISQSQHQEVLKLKEEATRKLNYADQFCNALEDLGTSYRDHFDSCKISVHISAESEILVSNRNKLSHENLYFSVCGGTSAGKSTLVNCLLGKSLLPSSSNRCTPCCILIQATEGDDSYFVIDNEDQCYPIGQLYKKADSLFTDEEGQFNYSSITVYVSKNEGNYEWFDLRQSKISLMDTPGYDQPAFKDREKIIMGSDVFVFVVDGVVGFNEDLKKFFQRVVKEHSLRNFLVVFNKWDLVYQEGNKRAKKVKNSYIEEALKFFKDLGIEDKAQNRFEDNIFFLSSIQVQVLRQCDRHSRVRKSITDSIPTAVTESKHKVLVCGGIDTGRSTVINMLLDIDFMPTDASGTPSFISFERNNTDSSSWIEVIDEDGSQTRVELKELDNLGHDRTGRKNAVAVYLEKQYWEEKTESILGQRDIQLFDTPHPAAAQFCEDAERLMANGDCTLIVVITARRGDRENRQTIINCLKPLRKLNPDAHKPAIFLFVNKWDHPIDTQTREKVEDLKKSFKELFIQCCKDFQSEEECQNRIFFTSLRDYKRNIESYRSFLSFSEKLLKAGTENFKETKFDPVFQALETCSETLSEKARDLLKSIEMQKAQLDQVREIVYNFNSLPDPMHEDYLRNRAKSPVAIFLNYVRQDLQLPDTYEQLDAIVKSFRSYCDDSHLQAEIKAMIEELTRQCNGEDQKRNLQSLFDRVPLQFSSTGVNFELTGDEHVVRVASMFRRMITGYYTIDKKVIRNGAVAGVVLGGFLTAGGLVDPNSSRVSRITMTCAGVMIGGTAGMLLNCIVHCVRPLSKYRRRHALVGLLTKQYCDWCRHVRAKIKSNVHEYHLKLSQSLGQAHQQLNGHISRFEKRNAKSKEERS